MAKTHSRFVEVTLDGNDISASVRSIGNVGLQYSEVDVSTLVDAIDALIQGRANANITLSGPFNNAADEAHLTVEPLNGDTTGATLVIEIGMGAAPDTGDPKFTLDPAGVFNYLVNINDNAAPEWSATIRALESATGTWGTV